MLDEANTFRVKKQIELLLEDIHDHRGDFTIEEVGAILGFVQLRLRQKDTPEAETVFITKVRAVMTEWMTTNWKAFPTSKEDPAGDAMSILQRTTSRFAHGHSERCTFQEVELIKGYVWGLRVYGDTEPSTDRLEQQLSLVNKRYDSNPNSQYVLGLRVLEDTDPSTDILEQQLSSVNQRYDRNPNSQNDAESRGSSLISSLIKNWYMILAFIVVVGAVVYTSTESPPDGMGIVTNSSVAVSDEDSAEQEPETEGEMLVRLREKRPIARTREETATIEIDDLFSEIDDEVESEKIAELLYSIGNLYYTKMKDYLKAAETYYRIVEEHPTTTVAQKVYPTIAFCYKRVGDEENERFIYYEMMEFYPKGSVDYEDAKTALGLQ